MLHSKRVVEQCSFPSILTIMKNLSIILFVTTFSTLQVGGASVQKSVQKSVRSGIPPIQSSNDSLIPSDSLFSEEETTDNFRQFLQFRPQPSSNFQHFQTFSQNPGAAAFLNHGGQQFSPQFSPFPGFQLQQPYGNPQNFPQQSSQSQEVLVDQVQPESKRKKDKQGGNKRRRNKRPQNVENNDESLSSGTDLSNVNYGYQLTHPGGAGEVGGNGSKRRRKKPQRVQDDDDYDIDYGSSIIRDPELDLSNRDQNAHSVKKQLRKKKNKVSPGTDLEIIPASSKTTTATGGDEERSCPGCVSGDCNTNNVISGFPLIQIIAAIKAGIVWAGIFLFLYKNFIAIGKKKESHQGYGYSPSPAPSYGPPAPSYGPPPAPPPASSYGAPTSGYSTGRISYPTTGRKSGSLADSLSDTVWNALDNFSKTYYENQQSESPKNDKFKSS